MMDSGKLQQYLVTGLLIAAAFAIGMLYTEVRYLKNGGTAGSPTAAGAFPPTGAPGAAAPVETGDPTQVPPVTESDYIRGDTNAPITLIEYSDYECPFCSQFHSTMLQVMDEYAGKVRWVYRHYPLTAIHPNAQSAAEAAECVGKIGGNDAFWSYTDLLFEKAAGTGLDQEQYAAWAGEIGVNSGAVQTCIDSGEFADKVSEHTQGGSVAGVSGTPGTIVLTQDGEAEMIGGALPFAQVKTILDKYVE